MAKERPAEMTESARLDADALGRLYDEHAPAIYAYLRSLGAAPTLAEDVLQEVFVRVARRTSRGREVRSWRAFLFAAARHEFYRWGTRILRRGEISRDAAPGFLEPAAKGLAPDEAACLEEALGLLPVRQREAVMMKAYGGLTFEEIARAMDTSINTAASRYRYGIEKLRKALSGER